MPHAVFIHLPANIVRQCEGGRQTCLNDVLADAPVLLPRLESSLLGPLLCMIGRGELLRSNPWVLRLARHLQRRITVRKASDGGSDQSIELAPPKKERYRQETNADTKICALMCVKPGYPELVVEREVSCERYFDRMPKCDCNVRAYFRSGEHCHPGGHRALDDAYPKE